MLARRSKSAAALAEEPEAGPGVTQVSFLHAVVTQVYFRVAHLLSFRLAKRMQSNSAVRTLNSEHLGL
jgi:hypothetical protein